MHATIGDTNVKESNDIEIKYEFHSKYEDDDDHNLTTNSVNQNAVDTLISAKSAVVPFYGILHSSVSR